MQKAIIVKLLIADDNTTTRNMLKTLATAWGYTVQAVEDGAAAWEALQAPQAPALLLLDWTMPGLDGLEVCRLIRETPQLQSPYIIILTGHGSSADLLAGLEAGADEYLTKPVNSTELRARLRTGARIVELQQRLGRKVGELEDALRRVQTLQGLLPICSYCKRVRTDSNDWQQVEAYISARSNAQFSHAICPTCYEVHVQPELDQLEPRR